jgi:hypothetical protein
MPQYNIKDKKYIERNNDVFDVVLIADKLGNLQVNSDLFNNIAIANGSVDGVKYFNKIGAVPEMPQNASGTIWDINGTFYPWNTLNVGGTISISTTTTNGTASTLDNGYIVTIVGLDSNYNEITEDIIIGNGTGTKIFKRINDVFVNTNNQTNIDIKINNTVVSRICIGKGRSLNTCYTVPAGYSAYITQGTCSCAASADATVDMYVKYFNQGFMIGHTLEVSGAGGQYIFPFSIPLYLPEKTDLDVRASVRSNKARVTASYDVILIKN